MSVSRKARKAKRERTLKPRPGRKPGTEPLHKDKRRFEITVFYAMRTWAQNMPQVLAAELAVNFRDCIEVAAIEKDGLIGLSFRYTGGRGEIVRSWDAGGRRRIEHDPELKTDARKNRRDKILREAPKVIAEAKGKDRLWLEASMRGLLGVLDAITTVEADPEVMLYALKVLAVVDSDWPRLLARLVTVHS
jgi:hypothetical protein